LKISIILPAYNEEARLPSCLDQLLAYLSTLEFQYEVIISADGCTDETETVASEYKAINSNVIIVSFPQRLGKGGGILNAAKAASGDIFLVIDVDQAVPITQIPLVLKVIDEEEVDIVYGSRYLRGSKILVHPPIYRRILSRGFNLLFRLLLRIELYDTQCGFKAIKKSVLNALLGELSIKGFAFDVDLAVKAEKNGYRLLEIPVTWSYMGGSTINALKEIIEMGRDLLIVWLESLRTHTHAS